MTSFLVERAQRGDHGAYEQLARGVSRRLTLVAGRILGDTDAADDAVQQALVAMWRDLPTLRDADRFEAWAYRLVVHACRAHQRRERRLASRVVDISDEVGSATDDIADAVSRDRLERAFATLSVDHRTVVVLHHLVGLSLAEIGEVVDAPVGTVASRLHHAMRAMRAAIEAAERTPVREGQPA